MPIGEPWARLSNGKCRFAMVSKKDCKEAIREAARIRAQGAARFF
jgi:hypothetical protein